MSVSLSTEEQEEETRCEGAGDADLDRDRSSCSSPQSHCSQSSKDYTSTWDDSADDDNGDHSPHKNSLPSSDKKRCSKTLKAQRRSQKKAGLHRLKQGHAAKSKAATLPPIRGAEGANQRIRSARVHQVKELSCKVSELQRQLREAAGENRLLRQLQGRHTVALQHLQHSESSLPQVLLKHASEVRAQQELLRKARLQRDGLARRLAAAEEELLGARDAARRLRALSRDLRLEERGALSHRLALATADLERLGRRTQDLERNLELSQAYFNRQVATETRKANEARERCESLDEQISQLTQKVKERERELEINNIYSHRFPKGCNKKDLRESKAVQTDAVSPVLIQAPSCPVELERPPNTETEPETQKSLESFDDTEEVAAEQSDDGGAVGGEDGVDEHDDCSGKEDLPVEGEGYQAGGEANSPQDPEEEEQTEERDNRVQRGPEDFPNTERLATDNKALDSPPRTKRHYTFKETVQNLHSGKPAHGSPPGPGWSPSKPVRGQARFEDLGSGAYQPSFVTLPAGRGPRPDAPRSKDPLVHSKKSSLMKELFGHGQMVDSVPAQTGRSKGPSSELDGGSSYHLGDASPLSPGRETNVLFF